MPGDVGVVEAVCVVHALIPGPKQTGVTAIDKRPVSGPVQVGTLGLVGDRVCDTKHHGGAEQALYVYAESDAAWWAGELGRDIPPGLFGENLRTSGLDVSGAVIGERWRVGGPAGVLLQVTAPRIPCVNFAHRMGEQGWVKRFAEQGMPGAYVAVVEPGELAAGDEIVVEHRPGHEVTIADTFGRPEPEAMQRLLDADGRDGFALTPKMRQYAALQAARGRPRA